MKHPHFFCLLLAAVFLFCSAAPGFAAAPGEQDPAVLMPLRETACGHAFTRAMVMCEDGVDLSSLLLLADPRVLRYEVLAELDATDTEPAGKILLLELSTQTGEELSAFLEANRTSPGVRYLEPDGYGYLPEARFAVAVTLRLFDEGTGGVLPPREAYSPADFSETLVSRVLVSKRATAPYDKETRAQIDSLEDPAVRAAILSGAPTELLLLPTSDSASDAARLALTLIEYETQTGFTPAQKALIKARVADVRLVSYEGYETDAPAAFLKTALLRIWVPAGKAQAFEASFSADLPSGAALSLAVNDGSFAVYHLSFDSAPEEETLRAIADRLNENEAVRTFRVYRGCEIRDEANKDLMAAELVSASLTIPGDVNRDGALSAADARLALRAAVGIGDLPECERIAANADGAGGITAADARLILRAAVGLESPDALAFTLTRGADFLLGPYPWQDSGADWSLETENGPADPNINRLFADTLPPTAMGAGNPSFFLVAFPEPGVYTLRLTLAQAWEASLIETRALRIVVL